MDFKRIHLYRIFIKDLNYQLLCTIVHRFQVIHRLPDQFCIFRFSLHYYSFINQIRWYQLFYYVPSNYEERPRIYMYRIYEKYDGSANT